jgi:hypothetical protein
VLVFMFLGTRSHYKIIVLTINLINRDILEGLKVVIKEKISGTCESSLIIIKDKKKIIT